MLYTVDFSKQFAEEFTRYPQDQEFAILGFLSIYEKNGLAEFSKYKGKISPSWRGIDKSSSIYQYAQSNSLWHAHIGLPQYQKSKYKEYFTSDMILHFQWVDKGNHIRIVDITWHYKADGSFWLPQPSYLK